MMTGKRKHLASPKQRKDQRNLDVFGGGRLRDGVGVRRRHMLKSADSQPNNGECSKGLFQNHLLRHDTSYSG